MKRERPLLLLPGLKRKHLFLTAKNTHFFVRQKTKIRGLRLKSGKPKEKIRKCEPEETREEILSVFERMKDIAKAHAPGTSYNHIKKWFLERYTEVSSFEIKENCEEEIFEPDTVA